VSSRANGLFHRAIVQSGGILCDSLERACNYSDDPAPGSAASSREIVNQLLVRRGQASTRSDAKVLQNGMQPHAIAELLRAAEVRELIVVANPNRLRLYDAPRVLRDGAVLPSEPWMTALRAGRFNRVPVITGTNRDERRLYQYIDPEWRKTLREHPNDYVLYAHYTTLAWKQHAVDDVARAMSHAGHREVYAYRFDWDEQGVHGEVDLSLAVGAAHAVELPFVFGTPGGILVPLGDPEAPGRLALSASMMSYWAEHAYSGAPARGRDGREAAWTPWRDTDEEPKLMIFDTAADGGVRMSAEGITGPALKTAVLEERRFEQAGLHARLCQTLFQSRAFDEAGDRRLVGPADAPGAGGGSAAYDSGLRPDD
jgi:para-nitrobenzyl esterase